jgi:YegS/Rv2252/BmrU family lipid kinase
MKTPILLNLKAGALHATPGVEEISELAEKLGFDVDVIPAGPPGEMRRQIQDLVRSGVSRLAVAGGDGTVHLAVQEVARTGVALGILPQGTANNFATALHLPLDLSAALRVVQEGHPRDVDLGRIGSLYFTEAAGVGLFADALALYGPRAAKNPARLFWALLRLFLSFRAHRVRLTVDDKVIQERAVMCTVANTFRMGLADPMAPGARVTDGMLDVVIVGDLTRRELVQYYRAMKAQSHLQLPKVSRVRAKKVLIESRRPMRVHSDDRIVGTTPVEIRAEPRALRVLVEKP